MKPVSENISLSTDLFHQFPWSTQCLILHLEFPSGVLRVSSCSSTGFSLCRGRWQTPLLVLFGSVQFSQLSHVQLFAIPWTAAYQASLSLTIFQSLLKLMSIESVMPSNHLILSCPLLLLPPIFPSIRVFPNDSALRIRWPKYFSFSFSISPSNEYSGLIYFRIDWFDLLAIQWDSPKLKPGK